MLESWKVRVGLAVLGFFVLLAIFGPLHARWTRVRTTSAPSPSRRAPITCSAPPSSARTCSRRPSPVPAARCWSAILAAAIGTLIAIVVGVPAGYFGGAVDNGLNFLTNLFLVMPVLPLILIVAGYVQGTGPFVIALIIGLFGWSGGARTLRAQSLSLSSRDFVLAMRMVGEPHRRLIFFEVLPHLTGWISAMFLHGMIGGVMAEAGLAFLGISDSGSISWGTMIQAAQQQSAVLRGLWWWFVPPGLCIALIGTAATLVNFGVDEVSNPKLRSARRSVLSCGPGRQWRPDDH